MISCEKVERTYQTGDTQVRALRGVSCTIDRGEFVAIAGPSGSGKSTLLNILGCLDMPDAGAVVVDGVALHAVKDHERIAYRRQHLGFVFQSFNLIPVLTAYENVALALTLVGVKGDELKQRTLDALHEVGLDGMEHRLPGKLSGGQQQRVAIARALVKHPQVVLADEPTANLDSTTGRQTLELMKRLNQEHGTTFLFSTHDPMVMEFSSRLIKLHDGLITEDERRSS